jgi:hypothetical protein
VPTSPLLEFARQHGPLAPGAVRVVVLEPDARVRVHDFDSRAEADAYASDVRWERDDDRGPPVVAVFDAL